MIAPEFCVVCGTRLRVHKFFGKVDCPKCNAVDRLFKV